MELDSRHRFVMYLGKLGKEWERKRGESEVLGGD